MQLSNYEELIVKLGLNGGEAFTQQIKTINKELTLTDTNFKKATSSISGNEKEVRTLETKLQTLNKQYELQNTKLSVYQKEIQKTKLAIEEKKSSIEKLSNSTEDNSGVIEKNQKQLLGMENKLRDLQSASNLTEAEMQRLKESIALVEYQVKNVGIQEFADRMTSAGEKITNFGKNLDKVANQAMKLSAPLIGVGAAALTVSANFEEGMSTLSAISGATGKDLEKLKDKAMELGATTSKSATEAAEAMKFLALAGYDVDEMLTASLPVVRLAEAGNIDLGRASDLVTDSMSALNLEVNKLPEYLDVVAQSSRKANTDMDALMEAYIGVGGSLSNLNIPLEESATWLSILANRGKKASEAGNSLSAILINLTSGAGQAGAALADLEVNAFDAEGNFIGLTNTLVLLNEKLSSCTEEQRNTYLAMIGGKEQVDTLNAMLSGLSGEYSSLINEIGQADGALEEMAVTMQANTKGSLKELQSKLESVAITLGEKLLPHANKFLDTVKEWVDWFANLNDETQDSILKFGAWFVAGSLALKMAAGMVTTIGAITSGIGAMAAKMTVASTATASIGTASTVASGGLAAIGASATAALVPLLPWIAGIAAVGAAGYGLYKVFTKEVVPSVDLFADHVEVAEHTFNEYGSSMQTTVTKISDATKEMVGAYVDMDYEVRNSLQSMYINSIEITDDLSSEMKTKYQEMGTTITSQLEQDKENDLAILEKSFQNSIRIMETERAEIISNTTKYYDDKMKMVEINETAINEIIRQASEEKRSLTETEVNTILALQNQMREEAINILSNQEVEAEIILTRLSGKDNEITTNMVSNHIQTLNTQRDEAIRLAEEEYNETIAAIIRMRDDSHTITAEQADKLILEAERQRKGVVDKAEEVRDQAVEKITEMYDDITDKVNTDTGEILTHWDKLKSWWEGWYPKAKDFVLNTIVNTFTGGTTIGTGRSSSAESYNQRSIDAQSDYPTVASSDTTSDVSSISTFNQPSSIALSGGYYTPSTGESYSISRNSTSTNSNTDKLLQELIATVKSNQTDKSTKIYVENMNVMDKGDENRTLSQLRFLSEF